MSPKSKLGVRVGGRTIVIGCIVLGAVLTIASPMPAQGQNTDEEYRRDTTTATLSPKTEATTKTQTTNPSPPRSRTTGQSDNSPDQQNKRILWVLPKERAVSAGVLLPPLSAKQKLALATQDSFD